MLFCKECENKLYPNEEDNQLWNKCFDCGFKELHSGSVIEKKNFKNDQSIGIDNNKYLVYDSTLPRTKQKVCPNKNCPAIKDPSLQESVFIQDPVSIKLTYICVNCNIEWKYS